LETRLHLVGGFVGEGEGGDLRVADAVFHQPSDAVRDDARLAASGPGQDEERTVFVRRRFALSVVETD
jgi:hypothetical protein